MRVWRQDDRMTFVVWKHRIVESTSHPHDVIAIDEWRKRCEFASVTQRNRYGFGETMDFVVIVLPLCSQNPMSSCRLQLFDGQLTGSAIRWVPKIGEIASAQCRNSNQASYVEN